jgi:hypothetical protein
MKEKMAEWNERCGDGECEMDIIHEIAAIYISTILLCIFGEDLSKVEIEYFENGVKTTKPVQYVIRMGYHNCLNRKGTI